MSATPASIDSVRTRAAGPTCPARSGWGRPAAADLTARGSLSTASTTSLRRGVHRSRTDGSTSRGPVEGRVAVTADGGRG